MTKLRLNDIKRKDTDARALLRSGRLAAVVMGLAEACGMALTDPKLSKRQRQERERRLVTAYIALRPVWKASIVQSSVVQALELPRRLLEQGKWTEDRAVTQAVERISGVMNDIFAPAEHSGKVPPRELVLDCLRALPPSKVGQPKADAHVPRRLSNRAALHKLFKKLGISGASDAASVGKMLERDRARKRR